MTYKEKFEAYKPKMTEAERMEKYFAGERVDHLPAACFSLDESLWNIKGYTSKEVSEDFDLYTRLLDEKIKEFDLNGIGIGYGLQNFGQAMGSKVAFPENGFSRVTEYLLDGKDIDLDSLEIPTRANNKVVSDMFDWADAVLEKFPDQDISSYSVGPFSMVGGILPTEKILRGLRKNPDQIKGLLDFAVEAALSFFEEFTKEYGKKPVFISDPISSNDLMSLKQFEEFSLPKLKDLVDGVVEITGHKPTLHICGHTKNFWSSFSQLDLSAFSVDNCEDMEETKEMFGDKMAIIGNVPPTEVMRLGTPEDVIESVKTCIKKAADSPNGYIINLGCDMPIGTHEENIYAYIYAIRKYGADAKIGEIPKAVFEG